MRKDHELLKHVFEAQKNPIKGDWTELVKMDMEKCNINEECFNTQSAQITIKEAELITALCSRTLRGIKANFHTQYSENLNCNLCELYTDTQEHCMNCPKILLSIEVEKEHITYDHIFGTTIQEKEVAQLYLKLLERREYLLLEKDIDNQDANQGLSTHLV